MATTDLERELVEALPARIDPYRDATSHTVDLDELVLPEAVRQSWRR